MTRVLFHQAAIHKASGKLACADASAAAFARLGNGELVTGDHDLRAIEGEITTGWLQGMEPYTHSTVTRGLSFLNSGSPVRITAWNRMAVAATKQSAYETA